MVKMSHSGRKRLVPSKVKVKESRVSDVGSIDENHDHGSSSGGRSKSNNSGSGLGIGVADGKLLLLSNSRESPDIPAPVDWLGYHPIGLKKESLLPIPTTCSNNNSIYSNGKQDFREQSSPLSLSDRSGVNHETGQDETSSNGNKDDEEDDDDESLDKIDTQQHDPERLKAFNMFVRLFVDENLDRMVPISKQPKEKIQAIIDSCTRQFPEFAERARKRIRTYLKSCRRNKRCRDGSNGWESSRPTPAHLTSVQAEQILAQACENESQNAKRMRMGLEPVGQPLPMPANGNRSSGDGYSHRDIERDHGNNSSSSSGSTPEKVSKLTPTSAAGAASASSISTAAAIAAVVSLSSVSSSLLTAATSGGGLSDSSMSSQNLCTGGRSPNLENPSALPKSLSTEKSHLLDYSRALNGNGVSNMSMYRPNFSQAFTRPVPFPAIFSPANTTTNSSIGFGGNGIFPMAHSASPIPSATNGDVGPTDLSMKSKPPMSHKLNGTEMATVRQLITGYRESAAFLLRSADELEQLLIQQQ